MPDREFLLYPQEAMPLPLDPDSIMPRMEEAPTMPPIMPPLPQPPNPTPPECGCNCESVHNKGHGLCLSEPYPPAKARAENERYARIIRNSFAGRDSVLTAVLTCFYHSMRFEECAADLQKAFLGIAICKMHHLKLLGELLISLGSDPRFFC